MQNIVIQSMPDLQGGINCFGRIGCLDENTKIYVEKNNKISIIKIKNLKDSYNVLSLNFKKNKVEFMPFIKYNMKKQEVYEIELYSGKKIIATKDHRFFNKEKKEIKVKNLKPDDWLFARMLVCKNLNPWSRKEVMAKIKQTVPNRRKLNQRLAFNMGKKNKGNSKLGLNFKTVGKPVSKKRRKVLSITNSGKNNPMYGKIAYPKKMYNSILGHSIRSKWEENVCLLLKKYGFNYEYESITFKLNVNGKALTYTPDLYLKKYNLFIEIKGPLYELQYKKMKKFNATHNFLIIGNSRCYKQLKVFKNIDYEDFLKLNKDEVLNVISKNKKNY